MPSAQIRRIPPDKLVSDYAPLAQYSFYATPPIDVSSYEQNSLLYEDAMMYGMYEEDKAVATSVALPMTQNVRGKLLPMAGVAGVTSHPTTRRQGYVKRLMVNLFKEINDAGMPVSMLYPFRESFYERLGYTLFTQIKGITFKPSDMKPLISLDFAGSIELVNQKEGWAIGRDVLKNYQTRTHGLGLFSDKALDHLYGHDKAWLAIARDDSGEVIGTMAYKITGFQETFEVQHFFVSNSQARYLLLQFIARHIDQVQEVKFKRLPATERPETWFSDLNIKANPDIWITPMGRVINARGLNGLTVGEGHLTLQLTDSFCEWNNGVFTFASENGQLVVTEGGTPDCDLTINALSALIYGTHNPQDFQWRGWGKPTATTIEKMLKLFPMQLPYLLAVF